MSRVVGGIMLSKKEAAEYLNISTRTLERYVSDGRLSVRYEESANGQVALFELDELNRLREEKQTPRIKPVSEPSDLAPTTLDKNLARSSGVVGGLLNPLQELMERMLSALSARDESKDKLTPAQLQGKLLLKLSEVQVLTGLSREILMDAIKEGYLPAQIIGKAYRIKFKDLEKFIDNL